MRLVVADTGPLNYLVLIGQIELLPALFEKVFVPQAVCDELRHREAPEIVRLWIAEPPRWIEVATLDGDRTVSTLDHLDDGERAAIELAVRIDAELVLIDERDGAAVARSVGLAVTGTLGILDLAADRGLIDLKDVLDRLKTTNFRCRPEVMDALLARHAAKPNDKR